LASARTLWNLTRKRSIGGSAGRVQQAGYVRSEGQTSHFQLQEGVGEPAGLAELMVFYCEQASGFASDVGYQDESYFNALVRMFEQALMIVTTLPASSRDALVARLDRVRSISHKCGYSVGDDMDSILAKHAKRLGRPPKRR
jgi:hypothetical protein